MKTFTASLHTHVRSIFDAYIDAQRLCDRIKELGGKGCVITDHGVLTSIEDYRRTFAANGLKFVPGVEVYVDGGLLGRLHLILIAVNDKGYKGISKIVTKSNSNMHGSYPMVTKESLKEVLSLYKGDIIALSACMQGVVSAIYLLNGKVEKEIEKIQNKQAKYLSPSSPEYALSEEAVKEANAELEKAIAFRDDVKALAERKFSQREKAVAKSGTADDKLRLEADKIDTRRAQEELPKAKAGVTEAKRALSKANKDAKAINESVEKYLSFESEIIALRKELKSDDELGRLAEEELMWYLDVFGKDNFYAEIQYHGIEEEAICFPRLVALARRHGVSLVATNDVHILSKTDDERLRRQILRSLRFGKEFENENDGDSELYLKDDEELSDALLEIFDADVVDEAIGNIEVVFNRCNVEFKTEKHYPKFAEDSEVVFDEAIEKGKKWRFPKGMDKEHEDRLRREIAVIKSMGYVDYHLVVKDFLEYARLLGYVPKDRLPEVPASIVELKSWIKDNKWTNGGFVVGPGRGSAVGSLVCYLLGITALDPLDYGLYFERFLNPERVSMPDIDSDISATTRPYVIRYCQNKYGYNAVCGVITINALAPRGCINAAAKYYGLKIYNQALTTLGRQIAKEVTAEVGVKFSSGVSKNGKLDAESTKTLADYLNDKFNGNKDALEIIRWARVLEGSFTAYGAHAAGIVISDNDDISEYLPLRANAALGLMTSQCNKEQVEELGLLKFDLLGLRTLDIATEAIRMIEKNYGLIINPLEINREDKKVFELCTQGKTNAVFQLESDGMKAMLKRFKPTCFEDLIILVSMFRPGPLQYLDGVIDVKNGKKIMSFLCEQLKPITGRTYGAIVYQEQVMEICQSLAGFTLGHADEVRRYMSKKKADKLAHERESFVEGCIKNGINKEIAEEIFKQMMDFASYAFNKSHATAYAFNAYITAWLKVYYPAEFFAAALNWTTSEKLSGLMYEANACGVKVLAPDINQSEKEFSVHDGIIRFGLGSVAGVKDGADEILAERAKAPFSSLQDFLTRCNSNSRVISHLIEAGAFDAFSQNRLAMKKMAEDIGELAPTIRKKESFLKSAKAVLPTVEKMDKDQLVRFQQDNGLKIEISEPTTASKLEKRIENAENALEGLRKEMSYIKETRIEEDKVARLEAEKELLGMYVSEHPMNIYPAKEDVSPLIEMIADMDMNTAGCYGIITNLQLKARKSDGATMAFFNLEDMSGSIKVSCFTKAYPAAKDILKEGAVVFLEGHCNEEESFGDEGGTELAFVMDKATAVTPKKSTYFMSVSSYAAFHLDAEECFIEEYSCKDGHELLIFDKSLDEVREVPYKVRDEVLKMPCVKEM